MTCIITGCAAFNGHAWVGGDLHQIGDCYVFNAITYTKNHSGYGEALWSEHSHWDHYQREVDFSRARVWERRGTLVALASECTLSDAAREYLHV